MIFYKIKQTINGDLKMNQYQLAVDNLKNIDKLDFDIYQNIVFDLAGKHPSIFNKLCSKYIKYTAERYFNEKLFPIYSKISCIKIYRAFFKVGLKEAKNTVEVLNKTGIYGNVYQANLESILPEMNNYIQLNN